MLSNAPIFAVPTDTLTDGPNTYEAGTTYEVAVNDSFGVLLKGAMGFIPRARFSYVGPASGIPVEKSRVPGVVVAGDADTSLKLATQTETRVSSGPYSTDVETARATVAAMNALVDTDDEDPTVAIPLNTVLSGPYILKPGEFYEVTSDGTFDIKVKGAPSVFQRAKFKYVGPKSGMPAGVEPSTLAERLEARKANRAKPAVAPKPLTPTQDEIVADVLARPPADMSVTLVKAELADAEARIERLREAYDEVGTVNSKLVFEKAELVARNAELIKSVAKLEAELHKQPAAPTGRVFEAKLFNFYNADTELSSDEAAKIAAYLWSTGAPDELKAIFSNLSEACVPVPFKDLLIDTYFTVPDERGVDGRTYYKMAGGAVIEVDTNRNSFKPVSFNPHDLVRQIADDDAPRF